MRVYITRSGELRREIRALDQTSRPRFHMEAMHATSSPPSGRGPRSGRRSVILRSAP